MTRRRPPSDRRFVDFVFEREQVRVRKASGAPPPWTDDEVLQTYRFTNIRRRDDRTSQWLRVNIYSGASFWLPTLAAVQFAALCRWVNWPPTIEAVVAAGLWPADPLDLTAIGKVIGARTRAGEKAWTGAYMIRAEPTTSLPKGVSIAREIVGRALRPAWGDLYFALQTQMRRPVWRALIDCRGWGSFMAGQVVDDLTWTPLLERPRDDLVWAPQGPGSVRGLNRVLRRPRGVLDDEVAWCGHLVRLRGMIVERLGPDYLDLTLMDVQNCLCEFDKYERVRMGQGRPRSLYHPETAY